MCRAEEICLAILGNRKYGNSLMVFNRLARWFTDEGISEMKRLEDDPCWDRVLVLGFDAKGNPLDLPRIFVNQIKVDLRHASSAPLLLAEAEDHVAEMVSAGVLGEPMQTTNGRSKTRIALLRMMYADRSKAWLRRRQHTESIRVR